MSDQDSGQSSATLPDAPNLEWLRKQAKRLLDRIRENEPRAKLADAQFAVAKKYGFPSWRALKRHIEGLTIEGQLFNAARSGDLEKLTMLLDENPGKLSIRDKPYEHTLLHVAAFSGHAPIVDLLLRRGADVNAREVGDSTYPLHWAAAAGHLDVVRRLVDAGGDVVGSGDDHALEVIGWACCWNGADDDAHRKVADFLVSRGARHHIFSAIALDLADEVRRIVAADPTALARTLSHNEDYQRPLHFAVRMNRPRMVELLLELGADPVAKDGSGYPPAVYATDPSVDRAVMELIRSRGEMDLLSAVAVGDWSSADRVLRSDPDAIEKTGALHVMAKRNNLAAMKWLLDRGADPDLLWSHWDARVTPLHLAVLGGHEEAVRVLLEAGANPRIRDSKHDSDAIGWATFFRMKDLASLLESSEAGRSSG